MVALVSCGDNFEGPPDAPPRPACHDNKDNDGDGLIDFPEDPGCVELDSDSESAPVKPQCSDNRDNDGDGLVDYPNDPGCLTPEIASEADDCPDGPFCPQCSNGLDDDGNGMQDYPGDPGCESAADNFEYAGSPQACGAGLTLKPLPPSGMDQGMLDTSSTSNISTPCGGGSGVPAVGYVMVLSRPRIVEITTAGSFIDTVVDLRRPPCTDPGSAVECHDDVSGTDKSSRILRSLSAGVYHIIVQGKSSSDVGRYVLNVRRFNNQGETCNLPNDCGPGLVCRIPLGGTEKICTRPVCSDGLDDDGDGKLDYPNDPGCAFEGDPDEADDCPSGPGCPQCSDGTDNDGDGQTDYPGDESCKAAGDASESCVTSEKPIVVISTPTTSGTTVGAVNDYDPTCNSATGVAPDVLFRIDLPDMATLNLNVTGFDTVHALLDSTCGGTAIACSNPPLMTVSGLAAGTYYVVVDAFASLSGAFTITTSGTIAAGGSCESPLFETGAFSCPTGLVCDGQPGQRTCRTQCTDGIDNNGDGKMDYPDDPGCFGPGDNLEDTVCPGATCPLCGDGEDNDGDGLTDYPADTACLAASGQSEVCTSFDPVEVITGPVTMGTTVGAVNDYDPTCNSTTGAAPDVFYQLDLPEMATLSLNVIGVSSFNTVHTLLDSTCGGTPIRCSDPPLMTVNNLAAGTYYVGVEAFTGTLTGAFTITTSGQVVPNESCEGTLFQSGALTCTPGHACQGPMGARTCTTSQCNDGIDNNGDGTVDFPADPSCFSISDPTEETVCPGPICPACSDGLDNDGDGQTDYPADTSCDQASGILETCNSEADPIVQITTGTISDTLVGAANNHAPTCGSTNSGADKLFTIQLPAMSTLTLDTEGSTITDTVLSLLTSTCSPPPIECDDDDGSGNLSLIQRTNVPAGIYVVAVDAYSSSTTLNAFKLNVAGTIAPGGSCEVPMFQSGAFTCAAGYVCQGPVGARTCGAECNDGMDNNGDGKIDYPFDPGCTSPIDFTEDTVCPGATCPACSNMADDDGDMLVDWPDDFGCQAASGTTESFCSIDPDYRGPITMPVTAGTLAAPATDDVKPVCQANTGNDVVYSLAAPVAATWVISTEGSTIADTVLSLYDTACSLPPLACDDDSGPGPLSEITIALPAGSYAIQVDSYTPTGNNGPFLLNVQGTAVAGSDCTSPLFASGVLVCPANQTCGAAGVCE